MNRRLLILSSLATLPAAAMSWPVNAERRAARRPATGAKPTTRGQMRTRWAPGRGGLTATHVRTRIVTRTFTSSVPIAIPLDSPISLPYPSTIPVGGFRQGRILKAQVTLLGFSHRVPDDLDIMLVAPGNVGVILMSDAGGFFDISALTITFDQNAPHRVPDNIHSGTFQPTNLRAAVDPFPPPAPVGVTGHSLDVFTNRNPNGAWHLFVVDQRPAAADGSLAGWALHLQVRVRVPHRHRQRGSRRPTRQ